MRTAGIPARSVSFSPSISTSVRDYVNRCESLLVSRYFMYKQLYFHPIRRVYNLHLGDFLARHLPDGHFPATLDGLLSVSDSEIAVAMSKAARDPALPGHDPARRILTRQHFRLLYQATGQTILDDPRRAEEIYNAAAGEFGGENVKFDSIRAGGGAVSFPVALKHGRIESSLIVSDTLNQIPQVAADFVFVSPERKKEATKWLQDQAV